MLDLQVSPWPNAMASLLLTARLLAICSIVAAACHSNMVLKCHGFWFVFAVCITLRTVDLLYVIVTHP